MRFALVFSALLAPVAVPLGALAACPVGDDLAGGIRLVSFDGEAETYTLRSDGLIEVRYYFEPDTGYRYLLAQGLYVLEYEDFRNDEAVAGFGIFSVFPVPPAELPKVSAGGGWEGRVMVGAFGHFEPEGQVYRFGEPAGFAIGACSYDMIPIDARYDDGREGFRDRYHYVPSLGFSYLVESGPVDGAMDLFKTYVRIEAVE